MLDYSFISEFKKDVDLYDFDVAIRNIEKRILTSSLSDEDFNGYTLLIKTILIAGDYHSNPTDGKSSIKSRSYGGTAARLALSKESAACAVSVAANAVSTYGLTSCFVPGPNCWAAAAGKALSLSGIYLSC
ncbi:hypothetical protein [Sphingobacterium chungjuense]|uniref:hypothetical protein n=1 Tax=Sphingobacterium chungjuense TaxID=2675553 RepID=UPI00140AB9F9|nr:hypothetical protein [Sphingobacterium chungjuense]